MQVVYGKYSTRIEVMANKACDIYGVLTDLLLCGMV